MELGIGSGTSESALLKEGSANKSRKVLPDVELIVFDHEEDWERESVGLFMKKSGKVLRYLFDRYVGTGYSKRAVEFCSVGKQKELLYLGELIKMYRDHNANSLNNSGFATLLRLVNAKFNRNDLSTLTFEGFCEYFMQSAIYVHSKGSALSHSPLVESVKALLKQFEAAAVKCGENLQWYRDPEMVGVEDKELASELGKKVQVDSSFVLPEGYRKVYEKEACFEYAIRPSLSKFVPESVKIAIEILDDIILNKLFRVHVLEPTMKYETRVKVLPATQSCTPGNANKKRLTTSGSSITRQLLEASPKRLPINMRLEVASFPKEMRDVGRDVAEVVDEIIEAVESNSSVLLQRKGKLNRFLRERQDQIEEMNKASAEKEQKRRMYHQMLKRRVSEQRKKEASEAEAKRKEEEELKRRERQRLQKQKEELQRERENAKKKIQEQKKLKEKLKAEAEMEAQLKKEAERKSKLHSEAFKKRKDDIVPFFCEMR